MKRKAEGKSQRKINVSMKSVPSNKRVGKGKILVYSDKYKKRKKKSCQKL